jgi:hypothetical protein
LKKKWETTGMAEERKQQNKYAREDGGVRGLLIGLAIAGAVLLVIGLWAFVGPSTATEKKDFVQAVGVLIAPAARFLCANFGEGVF